MRRRAVPFALLTVLGLLGAALWIGPQLLDWERYRGRLAELASTRLGRPVALDGPITLTLLPQARLAAEAVQVGIPGEGLSVAARQLRLRLDLPSLLTGRLAPRELVLVGGEIRLPWPAEMPPSLWSAPAWLNALDARCEACSLQLGELRLEGLQARLLAGGPAAPLLADGQFLWRGAPLRFDARLGRGSADGTAPLDLDLMAGGARLAARGQLAAEGGFTGRLEAAGPDLAALLPAPPGPFRASGRLTAAADLVAADDLAVELAEGPARGALALRLAPVARLDVALAAARLDLDAWLAALRGAGSLPLALGIDLSAEATRLRGVNLRRLRGGFFLEGDRLSLSDVAALLPGDTEVDLAGATAGGRLELAVHFAGPAIRDTLAALGLPLEGTDPARLRAAEGRFRLVLEEAQASVADLVATVDGARLTGAGVLRHGARPAIGAGLAIDRLDLDGLLPPAAPRSGLPARLAAFDLNLRLSADRLRWRGLQAERATLDGTLEDGRLALRRLAFRLAELDLAASGSAQFGAGAPRFADLMLEASGTAAGLPALLPPALAALLPDPHPSGSGPSVALRLSGGGVPEAIALRAEGDLGDLRAEAQGVLDAAKRRGTATLTLRHPGAPRLLAPLLGAADWLDAGSLALIATISGHPGGLTAESFDLVAGGLRARGSLALEPGPARPRLSGRIAAERLPLPALSLTSAEPLPLGPLSALDADLALSAARVEPAGWPSFDDVQGRVRLDAGTLRLEELRARLGGGTLDGGVVLKATATPPRLDLDLRLADAVIGAPLFDLPFDLAAGRVAAATQLSARGHSPAALTATLEGTAELSVQDGILVGLDLGGATTAAAATDPAAAVGLRAALAGGATAFERLTLSARIAEGRATLADAALSGTTGDAEAAGTIDLARRSLDLRIGARPLPDAPSIGVRLTGPLAAPIRSPELAPLLRWRAERG